MKRMEGLKKQDEDRGGKKKEEGKEED